MWECLFNFKVANMLEEILDYDSDEWQIANDEGPIEAATAEDAEDMLNPEFLGEHMSTINIQNNRRHAESKSLRAFC